MSESNLASSSDPSTGRTDTLDSAPSSQAWTTDQEDLDSLYQPVRYSASEPEIMEGPKAQPCRSLSAPGAVVTPLHPGITLIQPGMIIGQEILHPPQHIYYQQHFPHYIPHNPPLYSLHEPPALPPKPYVREGCIPEEEAQQPPAPRPMPRKISQPIIAATKEEQAKVAWEHGVGQE